MSSEGPSEEALAAICIVGWSATSIARRSSAIPSEIKIFCSPHIANFWRLRMIEGYISSIPDRLEIAAVAGRIR